MADRKPLPQTLTAEGVIDLAFNGVDTLLCHRDKMTLADLKKIRARLELRYHQVNDLVNDLESEPVDDARD